MKRMYKLFPMLSLLIMLPLGSEVSAKGVLKWTGCGISKKAFMNKAAKIYERKTGIKVKLSGGGATRGIRTTAFSLSNLGGSCRHSLPGAFKGFEEGAEDGVVATVVGWDAIVPIMHPANPVKNISTQQMVDIYNGKITNWRQLGGPDAKIEVQARRGHLSGVGLVFREILFRLDPHNFGSSTSAESLKFRNVTTYHPSSGPLEKAIERKKWAFGVTGISSARKRKVKIPNLDGNPVNQQSILSGQVSTFRPLYLMTKGVPSGEAGKFLNWLLSDEGQAIIESEQTVSVRQGRQVGLKDRYKHWHKKDEIVNWNSI